MISFCLFPSFSFITYAFTATRIWMWPNEGVKKIKKSNEKLNRMAESLELACLSACLFGVKGRSSNCFSQCAHIFTPQRLQPWPDLGPSLRLSLEVLWVVVALLFAGRGEVSREAEILREERHLISTLRGLGCQPEECNFVHWVTLSATVCAWEKNPSCAGCGLRHL